MNRIWGIVVLLLFSSVAVANPNNYIGIDADGNVYELNHGASSGSLNINEGEHYETYSTSGTDIIYFDLATQAELDASGIDGVSSSGATASDTITITGNLKVKGAFMKTTHHSWVMGG